MIHEDISSVAKLFDFLKSLSIFVDPQQTEPIIQSFHCFLATMLNKRIRKRLMGKCYKVEFFFESFALACLSCFISIFDTHSRHILNWWCLGTNSVALFSCDNQTGGTREGKREKESNIWSIRRILRKFVNMILFACQRHAF